MPAGPAPIRLFRPQGPDRVAIVSVEPASTPGALLVRVARGAKSGHLGGGGVYGPFPEAEIPARFADAVAQLESEGFGEPGRAALHGALADTRARVRARAATRIAWKRDASAIDVLLAAASGASGDICAIVDALGWIGDARAIPKARELAERKLLSRRRSGVEALRNLGDAEGLAQARQHALARLPAALRDALADADETATGGAAVDGALTAVAKVPLKDRGLAIDSLYEIGTPLCTAIARRALVAAPIGRAHVWRYAKSVLKRAMLRFDFETLALVAHRVEVEARSSKGEIASIKSGFDGKERKLRIFGAATQAYVQRAAWRYLRMLGRHRPDAYPAAAAEVLVQYSPADEGQAKGFYPRWSRSYLLYRVLWSGAERFALRGRSLRFRYRSAKHAALAPAPREHAFADLWDASPRALLRVLSASRLPEAHAFAARLVQSAHAGVMREASAAELVGMLGAAHELTTSLALAELDRRFDPARPDWTLLAALAKSERSDAQGYAVRWLRACAPLWTSDVAMTMALLSDGQPEVRRVVAEVAIAALVSASASAEHRRALAEAILAAMRAPGGAPEEGWSRVGREALAGELVELVTMQELLAMIGDGSSSAKALAGAILARRPGVAAELGLPRVLALAQHEVVGVRQAAHSMLRGSVAHFRGDPSLLFMLVESEWADTRAVAFELLRDEIDLAKLGLDGIIGLCDSSRPDVQDVGKELVRRHFAELDPHEVLFRLAEHPATRMQAFALELVEAHLKEGFVALAKLERFFRAVLLDLWPDASAKRRVVAFLEARALRDERQAEVAAGVLRDVVRTRTRADFEPIMAALARIKLAYPELDAGVSLVVGGAVAPGEADAS